MEIIWTILQFIIVFSVLLLVHELGHFIMCRLAGVPVEEFGFGLPPRIATVFRWRGTAFTLNALPFGAFVRPKGEMDRSVEGGLANATPMKKLGVYFGGPVMNLLFGLTLFIVLFYQLGAPDTSKVMIMDIVPRSPAEAGGLQPGDQITAINGNQVDSIETLQQHIQENLELTIQITVVRDGQFTVIEATPRRYPPEGEGALGVSLGYPYEKISFFEAILQGLNTTGSQIKEFFLLPARLMEGTLSQEQSRVVGIVGIFDMYSSAGELDLETTGRSSQPAPIFRLYLVATISIALGLTNLLPIPALDGGRIVLVMPELILRRRIPQKVETFLISFSFAALIILMIFITYQDFTNPVKLP